MNLEKLKDKVRFYETASQINLSRADIGHLTDSSDTQIRGWLDGYADAKNIIRGATYTRAHNLNVPPKQAILQLERGICKIAKSILRQGRALDARNPLTKSELFDGWYNPIIDKREPGLSNEIEGILQIAQENNHNSLLIHLKGRSGHLGYHNVNIVSDDFSPALEAIKSEIYDHYLKITSEAYNSDLDTPEGNLKDRKLRIATASRMLGITDQQMAVIARMRAADDTSSQAGITTVMSWRSLNSVAQVPDLVLACLQREIQKWAHYVLFISETDAGKNLNAKLSYPTSIIGNDYFAKYSLERLYFVECDNMSKQEIAFA